MRWLSRCKRRRLIPHSASLRSQPSHEKEYDEDDQDDTDNTDASVTVAVAVATEAATEAPEQEDDEDDDKYESNRHDLSPRYSTQPNICSLFALRMRPHFSRLWVNST